MRLAGVLEGRLHEAGSAIDQYAEVLQADGPPHAEALAALERLVLTPEHRHRIAQILEPIYRKQDWWQKLVIILDAQLEYVDDVPQRVGMLREIARLHEGRGGDMRLALHALARAWREDVSDEEIYDELQRVATALSAWDELTQTLDAGVEGVYDYDLAARLLQSRADLKVLLGRLVWRVDDWVAKVGLRSHAAIQVHPHLPTAITNLRMCMTTKINTSSPAQRMTGV